MSENTQITNQRDIDRVGLSESSRYALDELEGEGYLKDKLSGYRLAISYAIKNNIDIEEHKVVRNTGHMYLISQVDPDGIFATVIDELYPQFSQAKYRALEKFADLGIVEMKEEVLKTGSLIFWE